MKIRVLTVIVCVMAVANIASADMVQGINIDFVTIGHAGNAPDTQVMRDGTTGYGSVAYNYRLSKYEVTNAQWNTFTAVAGAPTGNDGGYGIPAYYTGDQQPTNNVSWYETFQFCNYLTSGDKSKGAYQFSGNNINPGSFLGINRTAAQTTYGTVYFLPTEDEWYKAAYYKPDGSGYSLYANGLDTLPAGDNGWNLAGGSYSTPWDVGTGTEEQNGTFDMMGNLWERNETLMSEIYPGIRGGCFGHYDYDSASTYRPQSSPDYEGLDTGFRVASVPEPTTLLLLGFGAGMVRGRRRRELVN